MKTPKVDWAYEESTIAPLSVFTEAQLHICFHII